MKKPQAKKLDSSNVFARWDQEAWLIKRLGEHGARVDEGVTGWDTRRERIREVILRESLSEVIIGKSAITGKTETYRQIFERFYEQPLEAKETAA